ncbi:MAG: hypothetical protein IJ567_07125 [Lachnospiraceae bacterium]|nr:hypothetical protein [Lachnospiraceae bacterium]
MENLTIEKRQLCDIQGRLFELVLKVGTTYSADAKTMNECWLGFHTLDVEMTIDDLKEICKQKCEQRNSL